MVLSKKAVMKAIPMTAAAALLLTSAACGDKGSSPGGGTTAAKKEAPTEISIMSIFYSQEPPGEDNVILKEIEKRTNTKLKITWVSPNNYTDKLNVTLASGDLPDMILSDNPLKSPLVKNMAMQGAFWDLTSMYKNYPNLSKFPELTWKNLAFGDGKVYGIPRVRPVYGQAGLNIRRDWLDKLGLKMPTTTDELYEVLKAFAQKDPDGNGKADTYGLLNYINTSDLGNYGMFEVAFNKTVGDWKLENGKLVPIVFLPTEKEALLYLNKLYVDKIIPEDFSILKQTQVLDMIKAGKGGANSVPLDQAWEVTAELRKQKPDAYLEPVVSLNNTTTADAGSFGMFMIPKKVSEAKVKKILEFMDYGASDEGSDLANYGIKDVHFKEENGFKIPTEQAVKDNVSQQALGQIFLKYDKYMKAYKPGIPREYYDKHTKIVDERTKVAVLDPSIGVDSETWIKFWPEFQKKIIDMKVKIIMGKEAPASWDKFVEQLKADANLNKIIQEMNDAYVKKNGGK
ncbi:extracellular solute-binding protein [Paenibacillus thalictri]|uniref:Extracellular solute-binding protein n=1 Tax=Paenibacillus thalictri TaxID=2527873 RepID=A0A4Q9DJ20_9BACL|nr:extracellular solute-binding protein [Paenibacillus thalictri]TBL72725.1 extracellular solute-binding protein [Paenibacillus thalictri]